MVSRDIYKQGGFFKSEIKDSAAHTQVAAPTHIQAPILFRCVACTVPKQLGLVRAAASPVCTGCTPHPVHTILPGR
jgi:hypothetical protein